MTQVEGRFPPISAPLTPPHVISCPPPTHFLLCSSETASLKAAGQPAKCSSFIGLRVKRSPPLMSSFSWIFILSFIHFLYFLHNKTKRKPLIKSYFIYTLIDQNNRGQHEKPNRKWETSGNRAINGPTKPPLGWTATPQLPQKGGQKPSL